MSDKPIPAEIVSPADLGIGDVIILLRQGRYRFRIDEIVHHKDGSATIWDDREDTGGTSLTTTEIYGFLDRNAEVCRILPKPVEVRDQWLVEFFENGMQFFVPAIDRDHAFEVAKTLKGGVSVLCERQSVISREEVQP